jgi:MFS family permease
MLFTWMVARYGGCRTTQIGMLCCAAGMTVALHGSVVALVLASLLIGAGMSINLPAAAHLLFRYSPPHKRNFIFSLKQTGVPLAWALMALIAPPVALAWGWRWALALVLVWALLTVVAMQPPRSLWDEDRQPQSPIRIRLFDGLLLVWRLPVLRWLGVCSFGLAFIQLCVSTFTVVMLVEEGGYTLVQAGLMLSLAQVAGVLGRIGWGLLADRSGDCMACLRDLTLASIACGGLVLWLTPEWPVPVTALLFAVFGATAIGWNGLYTAEVARRSPPGQVSLATGGAMVWNFAGILSGPSAFTLVYGWIGSYTATFVLVIAVAILTLFALAAARRAILQDG